MARYGTAMESQTAQIAGMPSGTTVNGYVGYLGAGTTAGFRLRRCTLGFRTSGAITSQQITVRLHAQTVAPAGTGLATALVGQAYEIWTPTDPTAGMISTTATTIGTTGPTLTTTPIKEWSINTQNSWDVPVEQLEELITNKGTANGVAWVIMGNGLPTGYVLTIEAEWEV